MVVVFLEMSVNRGVKSGWVYSAEVNEVVVIESIFICSLCLENVYGGYDNIITLLKVTQ